MIHPFEGDLSSLKDSEIESKLNELNKKYYAAARLGNPSLLTQLQTFIIIYKEELQKRYLATKVQQENDLDQLINVD